LPWAVCFGAVGRLPRSAQAVVSVPFWPNRASFSNQTSTARRDGPRRWRRPARGDFFEGVPGLGVAAGVPRPGAQGLESEAMQQVVDSLQRADDAELVAEDAADVLAAEGADAVGLSRPGAEPCLEPFLVVSGERPLAAAPGPVVQGVGPVCVVSGDPGLHLALGEEHLGHDLGGALAEQRQADDHQTRTRCSTWQRSANWPAV
jgi:hypothetical protein